jgi:energy-coupling factor transporter ATP-binding protein EcfA2
MLRNRLPEIEVPKDDPFKNDKLGRKDCADAFSTLVKHYSSTGCVIALNGEWGSGKSTFVKMFMQMMENEGGHPLYFNAWENDYISDPFVALLSELKDLFPRSDKLDKVISNGGKILTSIASSALKSILKNKLGIDGNVVDISATEIETLLRKDLDEYATQKKSFEEFKTALGDYVADNSNNDYPIVFFIDELDRCNPRFAVQVLERIKHLFDIPNIVFVLSLNKQQLEFAIQGYYGSSKIDATNYLRRFIDIEFSLPGPNVEKFCDYLYETYNFDSYFDGEGRKNNSEFQSYKENFQRISKILISSTGLDLRTTDKIFAHTRLAMTGFSNNSKLFTDVFFLICYLRVSNPQLYQKIYNKKLTPQEILNELEDYLPRVLLEKDDDSNEWRQISYTIASLLNMYSINEDFESKGIFIISNGTKSVSLQSKLLDKKTFDEALTWCASYQQRFPLRYLIDRIELLQSMKRLS